jgi:hypothetical protein
MYKLPSSILVELAFVCGIIATLYIVGVIDGFNLNFF